jgi:hypothetical protein
LQAGLDLVESRIHLLETVKGECVTHREIIHVQRSESVYQSFSIC